MFYTNQICINSNNFFLKYGLDFKEDRVTSVRLRAEPDFRTTEIYEYEQKIRLPLYKTL